VTDRETLRLAPPVILWWVWLAFVAVNVADYAIQGLPPARLGTVVGAVVLFVTGLAFTLALRPRVIAAGDGITVLNPFRTHFVPWRLITLVDTGEWVQVHYTTAAGAGDGAGAGEAAGGAAAAGGGASSAGGKTVHCWALYVSTRARRKIAAGPGRGIQRPRAQRGLFGAGLGRAGYGWGADAGTSATSRLPEEARYLASLPPAKAMAVRLDTRADRERARADNSKNSPSPSPYARWSWSALAAVVIPALFLLVVAVV